MYDPRLHAFWLADCLGSAATGIVSLRRVPKREWRGAEIEHQSGVLRECKGHVGRHLQCWLRVLRKIHRFISCNLCIVLHEAKDIADTGLGVWPSQFTLHKA
jgi:hypothetical protein